MSPKLDPFLISYPSGSAARQRLICFPFAAAGASIFREWPRDLPGDVQVFGVQLPGRENRTGEPPLRQLVSAATTVAAVLSQDADVPLSLFGHSVGALLAFEVARELRNSSASTPVHLFVSGCQGPSRQDREKPIHRLPEDLFLQELRRLGGTPEEILMNREVMELMLPTIRADFELSETYRYEPQAPLECPITVFGGLQDTQVDRGELLAWRTETRAPFSIRMFPGDHYFIRTCRVPLLKAIAGQLQAWPVTRP